MASNRRPHAASDEPAHLAEPAVAAAVKTLRVAAYIRYSSHLQDGSYSLAAQRHEIVAEGEAWGREHPGEVWEPVIWYEEPAKSARHEKLLERTVLRDLLRHVEAGWYDLVLVHKFDRLTRDLEDFLAITGRIRKAHTRVISVVERVDLDTFEGWMVATVVGMNAQYHVVNLSKEVKKGIAARAREGLQVNRVSFGYRSQGDPKLPPVPDIRVREDGTPEVDEQGRPLGDWYGYQMLKELVLQGYTHEEVADKLNNDGRWCVRSSYTDDHGNHPNGRFTRSSVSFMRANPFYRPWRPDDDRGTVRHNGEFHRGLHVAACTWEEWQAMQELARGRKRGWYTTRSGDVSVAEFRGILVCADCEERGSGRGHAYVRHSWSGQRTGLGVRYEVYVCESKRRGEECPAQGHYAKVEDVREAWVAYLRDYLRLPDDWQARLRERAGKWARSGGGEDPDARRERARLERGRRAWREMRHQAEELRRNDLLSQEEMERKVAEADWHLAQLAPAKSDRGGAAMARLIKAGAFVSELVADDWEEMTPDERARAADLLLEPRGLVVRLLGHGYNLRVRGRSVLPSCELVKVRLRPEFQDLLREVRAPDTEHGGD